MRAEDAVEDGIHIAELALEVESVRQGFRIEVLCYALVARNAFLETSVGFPGGHSVFLHRFVRIVTRHALLHQVLQQLSRINEAMRGFEVPKHALGELSLIHI